MNQHLDHGTTYRVRQYQKWGRELTVYSPTSEQIEGGVVFMGIARGAIQAFNPQSGQKVSFDVEFIIEGAESVEMAFEMHDDAKNTAVKKAQADLTKPKLAVPSGTTLPTEGPKL